MNTRRSGAGAPAPAAGTPATTGNAPAGPAVLAGGQPAAEVTISEALLKKLKKITKWGNLTVSKAVKIPTTGSAEDRTKGMARLVLLHLGFAVEERASELWSAKWLEDWRATRTVANAGEEPSWEMVHEATGLDIIEVGSSGADKRYGKEGEMDMDTAMIVGKGVAGNFFVVLHPSRKRLNESSFDYVRQRSDMGQREPEVNREMEKRPVVDLREDEANAGTPQKRPRQLEERWDREIPFTMMARNPVWEKVEDFAEFQKDMKAVRAGRSVDWRVFIGEELIREVELGYQAKYGISFEEGVRGLDEKLFIKQMTEVNKILCNKNEWRVSGEPKLYDDPKQVPVFVKEFMIYVSEGRGRSLTRIEQLDVLLRVIDDKHHDWAKSISGELGGFITEATAPACLLRAYRRLKELAEEKLSKQTEKAGGGSNQGKNKGPGEQQEGDQGNKIQRYGNYQNRPNMHHQQQFSGPPPGLPVQPGGGAFGSFQQGASPGGPFQPGA